MKILVIANCQARSIQACLATMRGHRVEILEVNKTARDVTGPRTRWLRGR